MEEFHYGPDGQEFFQPDEMGQGFSYGNGTNKPDAPDPTAGGDPNLEISYGPKGDLYLTAITSDLNNVELVKVRGQRGNPTRNWGPEWIREHSLDISPGWRERN